MKPFAAPLDDILFTLTHVAGADTAPDWDVEMAREIGTHFAAFAEGEIAPLDEPGDRQGCTVDGEGNVQTPEGFANAWKILSEGGWHGMSAPAELGGIASVLLDAGRAVPALVERPDGVAGLHEPLRDVLVAQRMLAEPVHDEHDADGLARLPAVGVDRHALEVDERRLLTQRGELGHVGSLRRGVRTPAETPVSIRSGQPSAPRTATAIAGRGSDASWRAMRCRISPSQSAMSASAATAGSAAPSAPSASRVTTT